MADGTRILCEKSHRLSVAKLPGESGRFALGELGNRQATADWFEGRAGLGGEGRQMPNAQLVSAPGRSADQIGVMGEVRAAWCFWGRRQPWLEVLRRPERRRSLRDAAALGAAAGGGAGEVGEYQREIRVIGQLVRIEITLAGCKASAGAEGEAVGSKSGHGTPVRQHMPEETRCGWPGFLPTPRTLSGRIGQVSGAIHLRRVKKVTRRSGGVQRGTTEALSLSVSAMRSAIERASGEDGKGPTRRRYLPPEASTETDSFSQRSSDSTKVLK